MRVTVTEKGFRTIKIHYRITKAIQSNYCLNCGFKLYIKTGERSRYYSAHLRK